MKRKSSSFGGGTGDINPQWFNMSAATVGAAYSDVATTLPRERLPYGNRSQVMEVLKVEFSAGTTQTVVPTAAVAASARFYLTTTTFATTEPTSAQMSGKVIARSSISVMATAGSTGQGAIDTIKMVDCTDGAGNGVLVATDQMFFGIIQTGATNPLTAGNVNCRILYRWKNVGLTEYIGIVQSQQ